MGSKSTGEGAAQVYAVAQTWVDRALRTDDSLFTPDKPIWSPKWLKVIRERYLDLPEDKGGDFLDKLKGQLKGSQPEVYQLMAEALYVNHLIDGLMKPSNKVEQIEKVLGWSSQPVTMPEDLRLALGAGLIHPGQGWFRLRPYGVGFIFEVVERWKQKPVTEREGPLNDAWSFKKALHFQPSSQLLQESAGDGTYRMQREALLHLVFPVAFEAIVSTQHKADIRQAFADLVVESTQDVDHALQQIREGLEAKRGKDFGFYDNHIRAKWNPNLRKLWDEFVGKAQACAETGQLDDLEVGYKVDIGRQLAEARNAVLEKEDNWVETLTGSLPDNPLDWRAKDNFLNWVETSKAEALRALQVIWAKNTLSVDQRIRDFGRLFPTSEFRGTGTRMRYISVLLMGIDVQKYPPFLTTKFQKAYELTGHRQAEKEADEAALYEHALAFMDLFIEEALERGLQLRHRLDAQSLIWMILKDDSSVPEDPADPTPSGPVGKPNLAVLAKELLLPVGFLEKIDTLVREKRQVIFQGPPGTGKTYVAQEFAACLAGSQDRVTLVQFHPAYAYEDFVQGFRPTPTDSGQPGFVLRDGPLLVAAERARKDPDSDHFLVIDEINRGNLGKVFGELYFLLEYRDRKMRLQYQTEGDAGFSLPKNLYVIGTMNTADRSIAMVDLALRRRFAFVEFHPDDEPIKDLLRKWLQDKAPNMKWVADVIDLVNEKLGDDRHVAIGPSYFMGTDEQENAVVRDKASVERIWEHNVLPYLEEHLFGNRYSKDDWNLDKLRKEAEGAGAESEGNNENPTQD